VQASQTEMVEEPDIVRRQMPSDLQMALAEPAYHPELEVWKALKEDGLLTPAILIMAVALATASVLFEALLFQGVIQIGSTLTSVWQRIAAFGFSWRLSLYRCCWNTRFHPLCYGWDAGLRHACGSLC